MKLEITRFYWNIQFTTRCCATSKLHKSYSQLSQYAFLTFDFEKIHYCCEIVSYHFAMRIMFLFHCRLVMFV